MKFNSENPTCASESTFRFRSIKLRIVWTYLCFLLWNRIYSSILINTNNCIYQNVWRRHIYLCSLVLFLLVYLPFIQDSITYFHYFDFSCILFLAVFVIVFKYFLLPASQIHWLIPASGYSICFMFLFVKTYIQHICCTSFPTNV